MNFIQNKICCISDLHIGIHQNSHTWHEIILNFFKWLEQKLKEENIKDIMICGDVFDNRNEISVNTLHVAEKVFNLLKDFNIIILIGNHDAYYKDRSDVNSLRIFSGWSNIEIIDTMAVHNQFDKDMVFCPWATELESIPQCDIIFGHFEVTGFKISRHKICATGHNSMEITNKAPLVISGHFHLKEERIYSSGTILYLGSPYELTWGEYGDLKGFYLIDLETNDKEFIENKLSPKHIKLKLSTLLEQKIKLSELKNNFKNNFVRFIVDSEIDHDKLDKLIENLNMYQPLSFQTEFDLENKYGSDEINYEYTGVNIPGAIEEFINMLDIENKENILQYTLDLYRNVN